VFFVYVTLRLPARGGHSSNKYCVLVYGSILIAFSSVLSEGIAVSGALHISHLRCQVAPQVSRNCGPKLPKVQKSAEKILRTSSYRYLRDLKKISLQ